MTVKQIGQLCNSDKFTTISFLKKFAGELLNSGVYRDVYVFKPDPKYVIKCERDMTTSMFANVQEWRNYIDHSEWIQLKPWIAPCVLISENGQILIQRRIKHKEAKFYPKQIPNLFMDKKYTNFGWIGNNFVCCDYPNLLIGERFKLVNANWWGKEYLSKVISNEK